MFCVHCSFFPARFQIEMNNLMESDRRDGCLHWCCSNLPTDNKRNLALEEWHGALEIQKLFQQ